MPYTGHQQYSQYSQYSQSVVPCPPTALLGRTMCPEDKKRTCLCAKQTGPKKIPGTVLLSHSQIYSTIAAGGLNYRVREGNVCDSSAMGAGKNYNEEK